MILHIDLQAHSCIPRPRVGRSNYRSDFTFEPAPRAAPLRFQRAPRAATSPLDAQPLLSTPPITRAGSITRSFGIFHQNPTNLSRGRGLSQLDWTSIPTDLTTPLLRQLISSPPRGVSLPDQFDGVLPHCTDVKVLITRQGRSRRMAFVGFKSQLEAEWFKEAWNGVWMDGATSTSGGSRVTVDWAKSVDEAARTRPGPNGHLHASLDPENTHPSKKRRPSPSCQANPKSADTDRQNFMSLVAPRKGKSLVQDILEIPASAIAAATPDTQPTSHTERPTTHHSALPESEAHADPPSPTRSSSPPVVGDEDNITDKEYMARRMKRTLTNDLVHSGDPNPAQDLKPSLWEQDLDEPVTLDAAPAIAGHREMPPGPGVIVQTDEELIMDSGRLFLRNLPFSATESELHSLFAPFGQISQVHILSDSVQRSKGLAYVSFDRPADALAASKHLDQTDFQGRLLHILPAVTRNPSRAASNSHKNTVKQAKETERNLQSARQFNWASLFMNADAVASSVADRFQISKAQLLDPMDSNPSVKLALAETHVITETKQFLEENGLNTDVFDRLTTARCPTTILVKNIPYGTTSSVLKNMFADHGSVIKVIMPPSGTIAVVQMRDKTDAKAAFCSLSYKRIGNSVIYLEKAPEGIWKSPSVESSIDQAQTSTATVDVSVSKPDLTNEGEPGSTLFVKNLSFGTTTEQMSAVFRAISGYVSSRIQTKPDPRNPGRRLSMGFGFVCFRTAQAAQHALKVAQGSLLDGHALELKFAKRGREDEEEREEDPKKRSEVASTKLLVKNVPFEINRKELSELFSSYGKLKSLRLPKKIDRKTRGFAFVEFMTKKEAEEAKRALKHTHLLGRHLVIEYAKEGDGLNDLDALRLKSGGDFLKNKVSLQKSKFQGLTGNDEDAMGLDD